MRIPVLLFVLVLGTGLLLLHVAVGVPTVEQVTTHPRHPTLLQGTDGAARIAPIWWVGVAFGAIQIAFFGACFALGMSRRGRLGALRRPILVGLGLHGAAFVLLLVAYRSYVADPAGTPLVGGFPAPTAVMLYLLWPAPVWFLWLYLRHFDSHVLSADDLARVRAVASERTRPPSSGGADPGS